MFPGSSIAPGIFTPIFVLGGLLGILATKQKLLSVLLMILGMLLLVSAIIEYKGTYLAFNSTTLEGHKGVLSSSDISVPLKKIQNIQLRTSMFGKIFHYGTIIIDNAGTAGHEIVMSGMGNAKAFVEKLKIAINQSL